MDVAKKQGSGTSETKSSGAKGSYRSAISGRFVGTKDGVSIIGPKGRSRHFTKTQARAAVGAAVLAMQG